jgi:protein FAM50
MEIPESDNNDRQKHFKQQQIRRQREIQEFNDAVKRIKDKNALPKPIGSKFDNAKTILEDRLKEETIGLQSLAQYKTKRERIEEEIEEGDSGNRKRQKTSNSTIPQVATHSKKKNLLSFADEDDESVSDDESDDSREPEFRIIKIGKDPTTDTSFLPDKERDEILQRERERLKAEWLRKQEEMKEEPQRIDYNFYDGTNHMKSIILTKGDTIQKLLYRAQYEVKSMQGMRVDDLVFVKEGVIVPHSYSFYELTAMKAHNGKGVLFDWISADDIRKETGFAKVNEATPAKIVERKFYEKNKHIFPFSHWEVFDEAKHSNFEG